MPHSTGPDSIDTLLFDLSEVLIPGLIGVEVPLARALGTTPEQITRAMGSHPHYEVGNHLDELFLGRITHAEYLAILHRRLGLAADRSELILEHFHACFRTPYPHTAGLLEDLAPHYRLLLHTDHCAAWFAAIRQMHPFLERFEARYCSFDLGATKRSVESFRKVLALSGAAPDRTVFIDDNARNIAHAQAAGLHTLHFRGPASVAALYERLGRSPSATVRCPGLPTEQGQTQMPPSATNRPIVDACAKEFCKLKATAEKAIAQLTDAQLHARINPHQNSVTVIVQHLVGNMRSRWTDWLTTDGEKPDRDREQEFADRSWTRPEMLTAWEDGWALLLGALAQVGDADLGQVVLIRKEPHTAFEAINRQTAHYATHVGQILLIAKHLCGDRWQYLTIPPGGSAAFNQAKGL
jgi:FMN phosphatase YigB (HAD superfamily)